MPGRIPKRPKGARMPTDRRALLRASLLGLATLLAASVRPAAAAEPVKVACVGDSITFGAGVEKREENAYPKVLGKLLGDGYEVRNFGVSGATLLRKGDNPWWKLKEFKAATDFAPAIVVIKLGTNDSKPQNWKYKDEFAKDYGELVDHFAGLPSRPKVYACLPVPVYEAKWGINEPVVKGEIIPIIQQVAKAKKAEVIDLYAALSGKPEMFPDKIHPNAAGAALMAKTIHAALTEKKKS
jgi:acyl-CoA thioesterase I